MTIANGGATLALPLSKEPPVLVTTKLACTVLPVATAPKTTLDGVTPNWLVLSNSPNVAAAGRTFPPESNQDAVLKPASLTPLTAWYSVPHQKAPAPYPPVTPLTIGANPATYWTCPVSLGVMP